jgi:hypothetical protein
MSIIGAVLNYLSTAKVLHICKPRTVRTSRETRIQKTMHKQVEMCEREISPMTKNRKIMLNKWTSKILRVYETETGQGLWRIRTKQELKELHNTFNLVAGTKREQNAWGM